jgi:3-hydroxyacyl-CoA dehydrogenase
MVDNNWLGDKTGQGFFKKTKGSSGEKESYTDLKL